MIQFVFRLLRCERRHVQTHIDPPFSPQVARRTPIAAGKRSPRSSYAAAIEGARPAEALAILDAGFPRGGSAQNSAEADEVRAVAARLSECVSGAAASASVESSDVIVSENLGDGVEFALRIRGGEVSLWCSAAYPAGSLGTDAGVLALAAVLEIDVMAGFKPSILRATRLGNKAGASMRSAWRVRQRGTLSGALEDNVVVVSIADALDEPCSCLWVCHDAVPEEAVEALPGVPVPAVEQGSARNGSARTTFCIVPGAPRGNSQDIRLVTTASSWPSSTALAVLEHMPLFALKAMMRWKARELADGFRQHVTCCETLRSRTCEQNGLYGEVRRRLAEGWPLTDVVEATPPRRSPIEAPFDGEWVTQKGTPMCITGSSLHQRGKRLSFAPAGKSKCTLLVPSGKSAGRYSGELSPSSTSIAWNDGDVWRRSARCSATIPRIADQCGRAAADERQREIDAIFDEYATSAAF